MITVRLREQRYTFNDYIILVLCTLFLLCNTVEEK